MSPRLLSRVVPLLVLAGLSLGHGGTNSEGGSGGCGGGGSDAHGGDEEHPKASGAACPEEGGPTAESFGRAFLETHCLPCHSASVTGAARAGAPVGVDFDTPGAVRLWARLIDAHTAAGPDAVNSEMPPLSSLPAPSLDERLMLGQWLACGAP
ncbi:hypothetical protein JY651_44710 [Pyxidicoccus parkwayensis]|uniref:Cytochrome c domain-containing protein n=1 Tax=Pyxidicoccus parkwayensis TaxID=2813578 RepID=A0ABX7NTN4_9BACT|nr:hypothetical protein [Pyxidicoccus parkwaysis]QSQ22160.1 hypothetical protein JY651_44710 [Pyxidicoccus parkwaysis]